MSAWDIERRTPQLAVLVSVLATSMGVGSFGAATHSYAQSSQLLPPSRDEIAEEDNLSWTLKKFPSQPYMDERYWNFPSDTPTFFRDSMLQFPAIISTARRQKRGRLVAGSRIAPALSLICSASMSPITPHRSYMAPRMETARSF